MKKETIKRIKDIEEEFETVFKDLAEFNCYMGASEEQAQKLKNEWEKDFHEVLISLSEDQYKKGYNQALKDQSFYKQ